MYYLILTVVSLFLHLNDKDTFVQQKLHVSRLFDPMEIEGLQFAISSVLDVLRIMLTKLSEVKRKLIGLFNVEF